MRPLIVLLRVVALVCLAFLARAEGPPPQARTALVIEGKNADGTDYEGTVDIEKQGDGYHLSWQAGSQSYEGYGKLVANLLTVDWGSSTPVVYALGEDGSLTGLWDAGRGEETLTPE
jgi:hypothetical protein